ncbi:MAG: hypothetical protein HC897_20015, partial [Thermoanaerobaculia bacterium]|nr:hypothetical protein [Thermoanaerobaculia bacterium]
MNKEFAAENADAMAKFARVMDEASGLLRTGTSGPDPWSHPSGETPRRASGRPQVDISFPEIEKFDHLPPARVEGATAFVSIMEGCSKYCTFCVVPYTRGEEVSRRWMMCWPKSP